MPLVTSETGTAATYLTRDGDMVDLIAFELYGTEEARDALFDANPGLADRGLLLPAGLVLDLPRFERAARSVPAAGFLRPALAGPAGAALPVNGTGGRE